MCMRVPGLCPRVRRIVQQHAAASYMTSLCVLHTACIAKREKDRVGI